jgi:hypothetical protein
VKWGQEPSGKCQIESVENVIILYDLFDFHLSVKTIQFRCVRLTLLEWVNKKVLWIWALESNFSTVVHFCNVRIDIQTDEEQEEKVQASVNGVGTLHLPNRFQLFLHHDLGFLAHINLSLRITENQSMFSKTVILVFLVPYMNLSIHPSIHPNIIHPSPPQSNPIPSNPSQSNEIHSNPIKTTESNLI